MTPCSLCNDSGHVFTLLPNGAHHFYLCHCPKGQEYRQDLFAPSDKKKERPIQIPTYKTTIRMPAKMSGRDRATGEKE